MTIQRSAAFVIKLEYCFLTMMSPYHFYCVLGDVGCVLWSCLLVLLGSREGLMGLMVNQASAPLYVFEV